MKTIKVTDSKVFAAFDYESDKGVNSYKLGSIVVDEEGAIGVVIQLHGFGELRVDSNGNQDEDKIRPATLSEIQTLRPRLIPFLKSRKPSNARILKLLNEESFFWTYIAGGVHVTHPKGATGKPWGEVFPSIEEAAKFIFRPNFSQRNGHNFPL